MGEVHDALTSYAQSNGSDTKPFAESMVDADAHDLYHVDKEMETEETQESLSITPDAFKSSTSTTNNYTEPFPVATVTSRGEEKKRKHQDIEDDEELDDSEDESSTSSFASPVANRGEETSRPV